MRVIKRLASFVVTPLLLVTMAIGLFLSIHNRWDFDLVIACTLVFTVIYVHVFENIIPVKPQWGMVGEDLAPDILHFIALIFFSVLGNVAALSLALHLHGWLGMELGFWNQFAFIPIFIVANFIGEFIPYWYHRISHIADTHSPLSLLLWRMHSIHHLPQSMNWRKTNWMHPINTFMNTFTRRQFLKRTSLAAGTAAMALPFVGTVLGANEKVNIACIGVGGKGDSDSSDAVPIWPQTLAPCPAGNGGSGGGTNGDQRCAFT